METCLPDFIKREYYFEDDLTYNQYIINLDTFKLLVHAGYYTGNYDQLLQDGQNIDYVAILHAETDEWNGLPAPDESSPALFCTTEVKCQLKKELKSKFGSSEYEYVSELPSTPGFQIELIKQSPTWHHSDLNSSMLLIKDTAKNTSYLFTHDFLGQKGLRKGDVLTELDETILDNMYNFTLNQSTGSCKVIKEELKHIRGFNPNLVFPMHGQVLTRDSIELFRKKYEMEEWRELKRYHT